MRDDRVLFVGNKCGRLKRERKWRWLVIYFEHEHLCDELKSVEDDTTMVLYLGLLPHIGNGSRIRVNRSDSSDSSYPQREVEIDHANGVYEACG